MSAPPRLRVVARGDVAKTHVARFSSVVDPGLARADITVTMARDDTAIMRRVRRGAAEATRPWLLTAPHPQRAPEPLTYVGSLEESQCDKYVLLVPDGGELRMVPCHEWYTFVPRPARIAEMKREDQERAQREAEEKMRARHAQSDLYLERKGAGKIREGEQNDEGEINTLRITDDDNYLRADADGHKRGARGGRARPGRADGARDADGSDDDGVGAGGQARADAMDGDNDVYEGGGEEAAAWMNTGLEKELGEDSDKGEQLDFDDGDQFSDDECSEEREGNAEELGSEDDEGDARATADGAADGAAGAQHASTNAFQRIDERAADEDDDAFKDERMRADGANARESDDEGDGAGPSQRAAVVARNGVGQSGVGKRERAGGQAASHAVASAPAPAKRPRRAPAFMQESDLVGMLKAWTRPPTAEEFMSKLGADLQGEPSAQTDEFRHWVIEVLMAIAMQIEYNGRKVLVLK